MSVRDDGARETDRLAGIVAVSRRLRSESDLRPILGFLLESAIALTGAERGFMLFDGDGSISCEAAVPPIATVPGPVPSELSRGVLRAALDTGEAVVSTDLPADGRFQARLSVRRLRLRSVLAVPFPGRAGATAVLYLDSRVGRTLFTRDDLDLVVAFAAQASLALENASLAARIVEAQTSTSRSKCASSANLVTGTTDSCTAPGPARGAPPGLSIVGASAALLRVIELLRRVAPTDLPVLIVGESGTGKELFARALHHLSPRRSGRFVAENCSAIPESLIESELFGAVRGAYTGADRDREGLFRSAGGGTLFLDEIGEMPPPLQARLLRALQEGEVRPVGSARAVRVDARVVAATHREPRAAIAARRLRPDLYYRLAAVTLEIPPLRDRREDIPLLASHFLARCTSLVGTSARRLSPDALLLLTAHDWPGNVRELENELERAAVLARGETIEPDDLSPALRGAAIPSAGPPRPVERIMIESALVAAAGSVTEAARRIGWSRQKLYRRMLRLGVPLTFGRGDSGSP